MCKRYSYLCYHRGRGTCNENDKVAIVFPGSERAMKRFVAHVLPCEYYNPVSKTCEGNGVQEVPLRPELPGDRLICGDCVYEDSPMNSGEPKTAAEEVERKIIRDETVARTKDEFVERACRQAESEDREVNRARREEREQEPRQSAMRTDRSTISSARQFTTGNLDIPRRGQPSSHDSQSRSNSREESSNRNRTSRPSIRGPTDNGRTQRSYYRERDDRDIEDFEEAMKLVGADGPRSADPKGKGSAPPPPKKNKKRREQDQ